MSDHPFPDAGMLFSLSNPPPPEVGSASSSSTGSLPEADPPRPKKKFPTSKTFIHFDDDRTSSTTSLKKKGKETYTPPLTSFPRPSKENKDSKSRERERKFTLLLQQTTTRLTTETSRANTAESLNQTYLARLTTLTTSHTALQSTLSLYKIQLSQAQSEILRAQGILGTLEREKWEAEEEAAKARTRVREVEGEWKVEKARDEGRRIGYKEGLRKGRKRGYEEGRRRGWEEGVGARGWSGREDEDEEEEAESGIEEPRWVIESSPPSVEEPPRTHRREQSAPPPSRPSTTPTPNPPLPTTSKPQPTASTSKPRPGEPETIRPIPPPPILSKPSYSSARSIRSIRSTRSEAPPPDTWIPTTNADGSFSMPHPYELSIHTPSRPPSPLDLDEREEERGERERKKKGKRPQSAVSRGSTAISQYDLVSPPLPRREEETGYFERGRARGKEREKAIPEERETERIADHWSRDNSDVSSLGSHRRGKSESALYGAASLREVIPPVPQLYLPPGVGGSKRSTTPAAPDRARSPAAEIPQSKSPSAPSPDRARSPAAPADWYSGGRSTTPAAPDRARSPADWSQAPRSKTPSAPGERARSPAQQNWSYGGKPNLKRSGTTTTIPGIDIEPPSAPESQRSSTRLHQTPGLLTPDLAIPVDPTDHNDILKPPPRRTPSPSGAGGWPFPSQSLGDVAVHLYTGHNYPNGVFGDSQEYTRKRLDSKKSSTRSSSRRRGGSGVGDDSYKAAPIPPGVVYPDMIGLGLGIPRPKTAVGGSPLKDQWGYGDDDLIKEKEREKEKKGKKEKVYDQSSSPAPLQRPISIFSND